jgi:hypothetical protein
VRPFRALVARGKTKQFIQAEVAFEARINSGVRPQSGVQVKEKIKLNPGETIRLDRAYSEGTLGQTDVERYSIVDKAGQVVGSITYTDHTALRGFKRTQSIVQKGIHGNIISEEHW